MKILVCAYSCLRDPDQRFGNGGEGFLGWNMVKQLSRFDQIWVLTHWQNQKTIEDGLAREKISANFYYVRLPNWLESLNKIHGGIQFYAYLWQIKAYLVARKLHKEIHFNAFHHVTYANDWMASYIGALLPVSYMRGPGGGAHRVPKNFLKEFSLRERMIDKLRSAGQWIFKHDPFFIISQNRAKALLVCNKEAFDALSKKWQKKAYFFPVNGVSKEDLNLQFSERNSDKFSIIMVGKLLKIKNFDLGVRVFKNFNDKFPDSELIIVGDGPELSNLKKLVDDLEIISKVRFEEWMKREDMLKEMAASDIFLFPSLRDGGGAVVVEAMAVGKPIVCFNISGPGYHVDSYCGIKIEPDSPEIATEKMTEALYVLYNDKDLRARLGRGAKEKAIKEYDWDKLGEKLQKIYKENLS
jgi:glycosyltransferase involved in cell wall biosynthesis